MHGILGFYGGAPSSSKSLGYPMLSEFLTLTTNNSNNSTLIDAWRDVHSGNLNPFAYVSPSNWAALYLA